MKYSDQINLRIRSVLPLALFFAYVLAFVFEGPAFYSMAAYYGANPIGFVTVAVAGQCLGLLGGGAFIKSIRTAKRVMLGGMAVCLGFTCVFFFPPSWLWTASIAVCAVASGVVHPAWGYFLKNFTPSGQRIKSCADVLIYANLPMILINFVAIHFSPFAGLGLALLLIVAAIACTVALPLEKTEDAASDAPEKSLVSTAAPLTALAIFVVTLSVNAGLMYQIIVPAFAHLTALTSWYWVVPYVAALIGMRNLSAGRSRFLYVGMGMMIATFILFVTLDRSAVSYLAVDTLMLGAFGIFDLFWWSIIGEMLDLSDRPARIVGIGLAANVFGILIGNLLAFSMDALKLPVSGVTIAALTVVCVTLMLLPPLNRQLSVLLKNHAYLTAFSTMPQEKQRELLMCDAPPVEPLTQREQDVLMLVLSGKTNKAIAEDLCVGENTVKTHLRNIYGKYQVNSRTKLISMLLKTPTQ